MRLQTSSPEWKGAMTRSLAPDWHQSKAKVWRQPEGGKHQVGGPSIGVKMPQEALWVSAFLEQDSQIVIGIRRISGQFPDNVDSFARCLQHDQTPQSDCTLRCGTASPESEAKPHRIPGVRLCSAVRVRIEAHRGPRMRHRMVATIGRSLSGKPVRFHLDRAVA